ncbi:MAG: aldo/keto reductase [Bacteroidales bacterium]|nr:aldo/keto reductase [Bacteroidales bacterium]
MKYSQLGNTGIELPKIIFGTSALGNLYHANNYDTKLEIVHECLKYVEYPIFDCAGKYGAGLALESLGTCLNQLDAAPQNVIISNKLGWLRTELKTVKPTFEEGVWFDLDHDAVQQISYDGIISCFEQGNELLGGKYLPKLLSVHDPDEYIGLSTNRKEREKRLSNVLDAYKALADLKKQGKTGAIGIGAKDWKIIEEVSGYVELDWVMFANSLTIMNHPPELLEFIDDLDKEGVAVINSAVFQSGFLTGGDYYDYKRITPQTDPDKFQWRTEFFSVCEKFGIEPSVACVHFGMTPPGVRAVSLNTSNPSRVRENVESVLKELPDEFYAEMVKKALIRADYPYLNNPGF